MNILQTLGQNRCLPVFFAYFFTQPYVSSGDMWIPSPWNWKTIGLYLQVQDDDYNDDWLIHFSLLLFIIIRDGFRMRYSRFSEIEGVISYNKANIFTVYFAWILRLEKFLPMSHISAQTNDIGNIHVTAEATAALLVLLDPHKSTCTEGLKFNLVHLLYPIISTLILELFNNAVNTCVFPDDWWRAQVTPSSRQAQKLLQITF